MIGVVDENGNLVKVADVGVPTDTLTLIEQLAEQSAEYARLAQESAAAAQELAQGAAEKVDNSVQIQNYSANVPGKSWITVIKMGRPQWTNFNLRISHPYQSDNISYAEVRINTINVTGERHVAYIEQIAQYRVADIFDAVRVVNDVGNDTLSIEVHNNANVTKQLRVDITGSNSSIGREFELPFTVSNASDDQVIKTFNFVDDTGIIADRAINDRLGRDIVETYVSYVISETYEKCDTDTKINQAIFDAYSKAKNRTIFRFIISVTKEGLHLDGGEWFLEGYRATPNYGWVIARSYARDAKVMKKIIRGGAWTDWLIGE